ncbi:DMT family transporter [Streptomyces sp. AA1529]|uniref:DMT family transporter n=1 Tax=Streptomyces sp. AA1529 TaxID=1203257 RepID=UPI003D75BF0D
MSALTMAVLLSLVSAVSYALAAIVQEKIASSTEPSRWRLLRSGMWWTAAALQGAGALLHVAALAQGPLTVVQPLGVLTLVLAAPLAALLGRRPVTPSAWRGIVLVSAGLAGILLLTGDTGVGSLDRGGQFLLAGCVLGLVALLAGAAAAVRRTVHGRPGGRLGTLRSTALALAAGVAYGAASVFVKSLAEGWASAPLAVSVALAGLTVVLAATGLASSQASYRDGGLATPLATATVANPVVAAAAGILLLEESFRYGATGTVLALAAGALTTWGLVVLTSDSARQARTEEPGQSRRAARPGAAGAPDRADGPDRGPAAESAALRTSEAEVLSVVPGPRTSPAHPAGGRAVSLSAR